MWKLVIAGVAAVALIGGGAAGIAVTTGAVGDDNEAPITGAALERASAAALEYTGGGRVTETEAGDEESLYEVEVTLDDGSQVDVQLDENFAVVGDKVDREGGDREGEDDGDSR
ncbi:MAG: PepSY domain-containing protein [Chloroflexi bacterium]|nr:PepSY domain-containing protein [Chloroflexota bacterium]